MPLSLEVVACQQYLSVEPGGWSAVLVVSHLSSSENFGWLPVVLPQVVLRRSSKSRGSCRRQYLIGWGWVFLCTVVMPELLFHDQRRLCKSSLTSIRIGAYACEFRNVQLCVPHVAGNCSRSSLEYCSSLNVAC